MTGPHRLSIGYCCALLACLAAAASAAEPSFPFIGRCVEATQLRAGPGEAYYVTEALPAGAEVEVYRRASDGWLAIRPLASSISLVKAEKVRLSSQGGLAEVIADDAVSWIGREPLEGQPLKWQVRLAKGEVVVVLGEVLGDENEPDSRLYRIAPPAGEFRWAAPGSIEPASLGEAATPEEPDDGRLVPRRATASNQVAAPMPEATRAAKPRGAAAPSDASPEVPVSEAMSDVGTAVASGAASTERVGGRTEPPPAFVEIDRRVDRPSSWRESASAAATPEQQRRMLADLQAEVALIASRPRDEWDFHDARTRAETLLAISQRANDRQRLEALLENIAAFEQLQLGSASEIRKPSGLAASLVATPTRGEVAPPAADNHGFDGAGWLMPVVSRTRTAPPFALMDDQGRVTALISPAPGVNLHRYARKKIGVFGQRGFAAELKLPHVAARRVVVLERETEEDLTATRATVVR